MTNIKSQISNIQRQLETVYDPDEAQSLAWWILEELTGQTRSQLICGCKGTTFLPHMQEIDAIIERLLHFEPIQYIFGHTLWCGLDLKVTPATLIPRPETAELVERVLDVSKSRHAEISVLDIGTGSGCIALALKKAHPGWQVTGIDISPEAIEVARENAKRNGLEVEFEVADIFNLQSSISNLQSSISNLQYDVVVSNPPYICECEKSSMKSNVLDYEPASALFVPDTDPLRFYRHIAELFARTPYTVHHTPKYLFFEINEAFGEQMKALLEEQGYTDIHITKDIYGKARIIEGRMAQQG